VVWGVGRPVVSLVGDGIQIGEARGQGMMVRGFVGDRTKAAALWIGGVYVDGGDGEDGCVLVWLIKQSEFECAWVLVAARRR